MQCLYLKASSVSSLCLGSPCPVHVTALIPSVIFPPGPHWSFCLRWPIYLLFSISGQLWSKCPHNSPFYFFQVLLSYWELPWPPHLKLQTASHTYTPNSLVYFIIDLMTCLKHTTYLAYLFWLQKIYPLLEEILFSSLFYSSTLNSDRHKISSQKMLVKWMKEKKWMKVSSENKESYFSGKKKNK